MTHSAAMDAIELASLDFSELDLNRCDDEESRERSGWLLAEAMLKVTQFPAVGGHEGL